jgi:hypothetical protein
MHANTCQYSNQRSRQSGPIQRLGRSTRPARVRREHRHRGPSPYPPLLPRRDRRHTSHTLTTRRNGPQDRRAAGSGPRIPIRIAKLRHPTALPTLHAAQQQPQQPGIQLEWQPARQSRHVDVELTKPHVPEVAQWISATEVELWELDEQQLVQ